MLCCVAEQAGPASATGHNFPQQWTVTYIYKSDKLYFFFFFAQVAFGQQEARQCQYKTDYNNRERSSVCVAHCGSQVVIVPFTDGETEAQMRQATCPRF